MKISWPFSQSTEHVPTAKTNNASENSKANIESPKIVNPKGTKQKNHSSTILPSSEWKELSNAWASSLEDSPTIVSEKDGGRIHPTVALGLTVAFVAHGAILFSLPPVLRGKGAPFLPTAKTGLNVMFSELRRHPNIASKLNQKGAIRTVVKRDSNLTFVDLGSGDGRVVFRAAREGLFDNCVGYEINPGALEGKKIMNCIIELCVEICIQPFLFVLPISFTYLGHDSKDLATTISFLNSILYARPMVGRSFKI